MPKKNTHRPARRLLGTTLAALTLATVLTPTTWA